MNEVPGDGTAVACPLLCLNEAPPLLLCFHDSHLQWSLKDCPHHSAHTCRELGTLSPSHTTCGLQDSFTQDCKLWNEQEDPGREAFLYTSKQPELMAPFTLAIHPNMLTVQGKEVQVIAFENYMPKKQELSPQKSYISNMTPISAKRDN